MGLGSVFLYNVPELEAWLQRSERLKLSAPSPAQGPAPCWGPGSSHSDLDRGPQFQHIRSAWHFHSVINDLIAIVRLRHSAKPEIDGARRRGCVRH